MRQANVLQFPLSATNLPNFTLSDYAGKNVILYFYPKDSTPGCTTESQQFRDLLSEFTRANCVIFGVSRDSLKSHEKFKQQQELNFELIADQEEALCQHFEVIKDKMMYGKPARGIERSTFLFDTKGNLQKEWRAVKADGHAEEVLDFVQKEITR